MRRLSPASKPFRSFSQFGSILEIINPTYDSHAPSQSIPRSVVTKPQTRRSTPLHIRAKRALEAEDQSEISASMSLVLLRRQRNVYKDKPLSPGHYHPRPDFLLPKATNTTIGRAASLPMFGEIYCVKEVQNRKKYCSGKHRSGKVSPLPHIKGVDWGRQSIRGQLFDTKVGASEGRFAAEPGSTMEKDRGLKFERMEARRELWQTHEHLPQYSPRFDTVSLYPLR